MARETAASIRADFHPALIGPLRCGGPRISALLTARFRTSQSRQSESDARHNRVLARGSL